MSLAAALLLGENTAVIWLIYLFIDAILGF